MEIDDEVSKYIESDSEYDEEEAISEEFILHKSDIIGLS